MQSLFARIFRPYRVPPEALPTFKHDLPYGISKGFVLAGSASVAGVIVKKTFDASDFQVALLHGAVSFGLFFSILLSSHAEKPNKLRYAVLPDLAARLLFIGTGLISFLFPQPWVFTAMLCLAFALNSLNTPVVTSIYRSNYPDHSRARIMGIVRTCFNFAFVAASYMFGVLLDWNGMNYIYVYPIIGLVGLWGLNSFSKIAVQPSTGERLPGHPFVEMKQVLKSDKPFAHFMGYWAIFGFAALMVDPVKTIFVTDTRFGIGASYEEAILAVTVIPQAVMLLSFAFWGKQIDKYGVIKIRFILNILPTCSLLLFYFATDLKLVYAASVIQGISMSGAQLSWQLCVMEFAPANRVGIYMGIHTMLTGLRGMLAPFAGAWLIGFAGMSNTFLIGFGLMVISTLMMIRFARDHGPEHGPLRREFVPNEVAKASG